MKLLLARHGQTDWNAVLHIQGSTDTDLNETGRQQARLLGQRLLEQSIALDGIAVSTMRRARQTADIAGQMLGICPTVLDGLEEMCMGRWEGLSWDEVRAQYPAEYAAWDKSPRHIPAPGGECYQDVLNRFVPALQKIAAQARGDWLVVTHSGNIAALLAEIHGIPFREVGVHYKIRNAEWLCVDAGSLPAKTPFLRA